MMLGVGNDGASYWWWCMGVVVYGVGGSCA